MPMSNTLLRAEKSTNVRVASATRQPALEDQGVSEEQQVRAVEELLELESFDMELEWSEIEADLFYGRD